MVQTDSSTITIVDLPALYKAADRTSQNAQADYLKFLRADLFLLILGALLTSVSIQSPGIARWLAVLGGLVLVASLLLTMLISTRSYEQQWYGGRAMAESIKTLAWKYMCGADPFGISRTQAEVDGLFRDSLVDVLKQADRLALSLDVALAHQAQITDKMLEMRSKSLEQRKQIYLTDRIQDQQDWYSMKAALNKSKQRIYFNAIIGVQFLAIAFSFLLVAVPSFPVNFPSVLSALAAALIAWLQVKRHQELAQSYVVADQELGLIALDARYIDTEEKFAQFVADAEASISREHTLWVARRDISLTRW